MGIGPAGGQGRWAATRLRLASSADSDLHLLQTYSAFRFTI